MRVTYRAEVCSECGGHGELWYYTTVVDSPDGTVQITGTCGPFTSLDAAEDDFEQERKLESEDA